MLTAHAQNCRIEKSFLIDVVSKIYVATDSAPVDMQTYELCSDMIDVVVDVSCIYGYVPHWPAKLCALLFVALNPVQLSTNVDLCLCSMKDSIDGIAYDSQSQSIIKLNNGMVLYLREVNR